MRKAQHAYDGTGFACVNSKCQTRHEGRARFNNKCGKCHDIERRRAKNALIYQQRKRAAEKVTEQAKRLRIMAAQLEEKEQEAAHFREIADRQERLMIHLFESLQSKNQQQPPTPQTPKDAELAVGMQELKAAHTKTTATVGFGTWVTSPTKLDISGQIPLIHLTGKDEVAARKPGVKPVHLYYNPELDMVFKVPSSPIVAHWANYPVGKNKQRALVIDTSNVPDDWPTHHHRLHRRRQNVGDLRFGRGAQCASD